MFLDPNSIEAMMWSSSGLGITDHGKGAYQEAFTLFCTKYLPHSQFVPEFVSGAQDDDDEIIFSEANVMSDNHSQITEEIRTLTQFT